MAGGQISQLIRMIEQLPEEQGQQLLKSLFIKDPITAIRILQRHFSFDDLVYASDEGLASLLDALGEDTVAASLVGASDQMVRRFADQLGTAKARTFIEDVHEAKHTPQVVEASRRAVLTKAMYLHRAGTLSIARPGID